MNTKALRQKVLDLAIHGKLVPQNPNDESATVLLEKIRAEKAEKIKKGELKADKKDSFIFVGSDKRHYEQFADGTVKDIEDEIPFEVPDGWAWCRLNELADIARGGSPRPIENYITDSPDGINWIKIGDTAPESKYIESAKEKIKPEGQKHSRFVHEGDFLLTNSMSFGRPYILKINGCIHDGWLVFANIKECVIKDYLYYALSSDYIYASFSMVAAGSTVKNLKSDTVKQVLFPLPPIKTQEKIVESIEKSFSQIDILDNEKLDLQTIIKQTKSKILDLAIHGKLVPQDPNDEPAEELLKRIATSDNRPYKKFDDDITFSLPKNWEWCYLGDICKVSSAKRVLQQDWKDSGIPFYRAREIAQLSNNENVKDDLFITPELYDELKNKYGVPVSGDLMISAVGTIGKVYIVKESDCFYYKDASVICFSKKEKSIDSKYLKLCLESGFLQNQIYSQSTGTTVDTITINKAQEYLFPLPNIKEQQRIVSKIEELFLYLDTISSNLE